MPLSSTKMSHRLQPQRADDLLQQTESHIQRSPQSTHVTLASLTRVNPMDLLKKGSHNVMVLEKLRAKIQQQQLKTISLVPEINMKCQDHIIRKVCEVSSKGEGIQPGIPVSRWKAQINPFSGKAHQINQTHEDTARRKLHKKKFPQKTHQQTAALNTADSSSSNESNMIKKSRNHPCRNILCKSNQATNPSRSRGKSKSVHHVSVKEIENKGPAKQITAQIQNAQEVREYMFRQVLKRRRMEIQIKRKTQFEKERKRISVQEIVKKQKEALRSTRKLQTQQYEKSKNADKERFVKCNKTLGLQCNEQYAVLDTSRPLQMELGSKRTYVNSSLIIPAEAQRHRVEALKKTIASLDARVQNETARLSITSQKEFLTYTRHTSSKQKTAEKKKKKKEMKESVAINGNVPIKKEIEITADKQTCPGMHVLHSDRRINQCTSNKGDDTENTEFTNKWSDLSRMHSQEEFQCHISLAQSQQFIWEEELRAHHISALFRLREKALWERTRAELTWLERCKKTALSEEDSLVEIKKKQKDVLQRLRHEEAEIHHWRNIYKCGQQQRRLLLYHHRDIQDINKSTTHIRQVLETHAMTETDFSPRDTVTALEVKSLSTKPGIIPAAKGKKELPSKQGSFFTKAGLRRLLTADEVWSLGRKRSLGEHNIPTEQEILQTTGSKDVDDPQCISAYNHRRKPCHNTSTDRKVKREDGKPSHKQESLKANSKPDGYELTPAKNGKSPQSKGSPKSTEIHSREKVYWKSVKDLHHLTSEHNQSSCGTSDKVPIGSCLSSDIEEDLPYDYEDIHQQPAEETEARFQEKLNYSSFEMTVDCEKVLTDNLTFNLKNSHENVVFNNNHEICNVARELNTAYLQTNESELVSQISENLKWQDIADLMIDKPLVTNSVVAVSSDMKGTDSPSCDDSLSEAEDKSEPFSLQSEGLVWSEEEKDVHSEEKSKTGTFALVYAEKFTVIPESPLYCHKSNNEHCKVDSYGLNEKHITAESNLSEILSPVDEVLSYGSAELPPSLKGGGGPELDINSLAPPSPAFEIITWTSEENLPAPSDFLEDSSINSENIPPLPVDLTRERETERPSKTSVNNDANNGVLCQMLLSAEDDQEDEVSEYSSSFPVDDSKDSEDLLSSFNIGDRVLVCNSRPGVLKYKGYTAFADGFWAGVALDTPKGNHNGTFRGVKYFTCQKSCGVLVRAEDISCLHGEQCNNADTSLDIDTCSDEDPPNNQDGKNGNKPYGEWQRRENSRHCSFGHGLSAPKQTFQQEPCETDEAADNVLPMFLTSIERIPLNIDCTSHLDDSEVLIERLTEEIFAAALKSIQEKAPTHVSKSKEINFRTKETGNVINKPGLMDKWQQVYPETPPLICVKPHEQMIVYKLVENTVEILCGQANKSVLDACETPNYLVDDKSCQTYRQVLFQLASDILNKICADLLDVSGTFQKTMDKSVISRVETRQISVSLLKDAVKRETQKVLNLGKNDQEMTEMLQTLCKYWYAKRDKVDYILIQELHKEETEWVDYSNDQITVKMQLSNQIFSYLLDDTISLLNQIYVEDNK